MNITSWLQYDFMRNALIAVLIITPLFGIMGTMIVNKKMAYFSDALGHSALTDIIVSVDAVFRLPILLKEVQTLSQISPWQARCLPCRIPLRQRFR